jgi:hypothetical protein
MSAPVSFEDLEIVGYADTLTTDLLPRLVAPIYRRRSKPGEFVIPPFAFEDGKVVGAAQSAEVDFERALADGQATQIKTPLPAKAGYQLWIDRNGAPQYAPAREVSVQLRHLASDHVRKAEEAFRKGSYEEASRLAQVAIAADERCLDALLVKAVVLKQEGKQEEIEVIGDIAKVLVPDVDFESQLKKYEGRLRAKRRWHVVEGVLGKAPTVQALPFARVGLPPALLGILLLLALAVTWSSRCPIGL